MVYLSAKHSRSLVWWEDTKWKTLWRTFKRTNYPVWFIGWVLPYLCERPVKNPSIWKESIPWNIPWTLSVRGWNLEGWYDGCRHWGAGEDGRIGKLCKKTQCERGDISQRKRKIHFSSRRWTNIIRWRRSGTENIHPDSGSPNSREDQRDFLGDLGESEGSPPPLPQDSLLDAGEAISDFCSMSGNFIYRHHVEPRVQLYSPREESFPIPLKYIDVSRTTHTNLNVMLEGHIDNYWNIDESRDLSGSWTGFTQFTFAKKNFTTDTCGPGEDSRNGKQPQDLMICG